MRDLTTVEAATLVSQLTAYEHLVRAVQELPARGRYGDAAEGAAAVAAALDEWRRA